ncbi:hypothetical protein ASG90_01425 [Nocardioides sp. Soil797]|nr:hypothetical protein ASG90_01425 [Nocardioides sp. Soil797]
MITADRYADLAHRVGEDFGASGWMTVDQDLIDRFADLTGDHMWVHSDPERAARELDGGRPIAHGLLTFSLIPRLSYQVVDVPDPGLTFSYGTNRLRYISPVSAGDRIRLHVSLLSAERDVQKDGPSDGRRGSRSGADGAGSGDTAGRTRTFLTFKYVMEIEGKEKPALVSEQVLLTHG